jgi:hypothetical protein
VTEDPVIGCVEAHGIIRPIDCVMTETGNKLGYLTGLQTITE